MIALLSAALVIGAVGSTHCVGMCGPLGLLIPLNRQSKLSIIGGLLTYHVGRLATYALLGAAFGLLGRGLFIGQWQQYLSVLLGLLVLALLVFEKPLTHFFTGSLSQTGLYQRTFRFVKSFKQQHPHIARLLLGSVNGLLPCGLIYLGLAYAIAAASASSGALVMLAFGLGTLPLVLITNAFTEKIKGYRPNWLRWLYKPSIAITGLFLIYRGLNLNLPFSPKIDVVQAVISLCH